MEDPNGPLGMVQDSEVATFSWGVGGNRKRPERASLESPGGKMSASAAEVRGP